ncbi:hypothetical protein HBI80_056670 [Parastagonospora nodorum]|nr:hypothetical protein HBI80_056670 [Parastagonospora nodorum]
MAYCHVPYLDVFSVYHSEAVVVFTTGERAMFMAANGTSLTAHLRKVHSFSKLRNAVCPRKFKPGLASSMQGRQSRISSLES